MKSALASNYPWVVLLVLALGSCASTPEEPAWVAEARKITIGTNGLFSENIQQELDLPVALFQKTNTSFDEKVYESVRRAIKPPAIISFHMITFVFSSPSTNDLVFSFCEMGQPDELICTGKSVSRRPGSTNEVPLNRIRTVDRHKKDVAADLDVLVGVAPPNDPQDVRYFRRSFRFVYRDGWKEY
jgi:hypothetical protein